MISPFYDEEKLGRLKSASYEVNPGGLFIFWDEQGHKKVEKINKEGTFTLPRNSISFVQLEAEFRLPQYIAVRFNLRITHVHRGLLLGTGPLVDPGFHGNLLIPLHNLTSDPYTIRGDEGLIWIEFTKTSHLASNLRRVEDPTDTLTKTEIRKNRQPPEYYFDKANKNRPIQSSIPRFVADARDLSESANKAATRAENSNRIFVGVGLLAIAGTVIGIFSFLEAVKGNVIAAYNLASSVSIAATQAASDAKKAQGDVKELKTQVETSDAKRSSDDVQRLRTQVDQARSEINSMRSDIRQLTEQIRTHLLPSKK